MGSAGCVDGCCGLCGRVLRAAWTGSAGCVDECCGLRGRVLRAVWTGSAGCVDECCGLHGRVLRAAWTGAAGCVDECCGLHGRVQTIEHVDYMCEPVNMKWWRLCCFLWVGGTQVTSSVANNWLLVVYKEDEAI